MSWRWWWNDYKARGPWKTWGREQTRLVKVFFVPPQIQILTNFPPEILRWYCAPIGDYSIESLCAGYARERANCRIQSRQKVFTSNFSLTPTYWLRFYSAPETSFCNVVLRYNRIRFRKSEDAGKYHKRDQPRNPVPQIQLTVSTKAFTIPGREQRGQVFPQISSFSRPKLIMIYWRFLSL